MSKEAEPVTLESLASQAAAEIAEKTCPERAMTVALAASLPMLAALRRVVEESCKAVCLIADMHRAGFTSDGGGSAECLCGPCVRIRQRWEAQR